MRAEQEKERIEKAQSVLHRLADGQKHRVPDLWQGGPVVEWQLRFLKRLQRESMVLQQGDGFQATNRMLPLLKAASTNVPAVVELLWPERAKDVLKALARLPVTVTPPALAPTPYVHVDADDDETLLFAFAIDTWLRDSALPRHAWYRVKDLLPHLDAETMFPNARNIQEKWNALGKLLSGGSRRLQTFAGWIVERRNGDGSTEYRLIQKATALTAVDVPVPAPPPPPAPPIELDRVVLPALALASSPVELVVFTLRQHGPLPKRELQDKIGGKRQNAADAIDTALREGACFFGHVPGHVRARMYLQEQLDAAEVEHAQVPQDDDGHETDDDVATATAADMDAVDDETFKAMVLKYTLIYGQNFITLGEHLRVLHESVALLHEKIDALLEKKA